jgi:hypothetical protein
MKKILKRKNKKYYAARNIGLFIFLPFFWQTVNFFILGYLDMKSFIYSCISILVLLSVITMVQYIYFNFFDKSQ